MGATPHHHMIIPHDFRCLKPLVLRLGIPTRHTCRFPRVRSQSQEAIDVAHADALLGREPTVIGIERLAFWDQFNLKKGAFWVSENTMDLKKYNWDRCFFLYNISHVLRDFGCLTVIFFLQKPKPWQSGSHGVVRKWFISTMGTLW